MVFASPTTSGQSWDHRATRVSSPTVCESNIPPSTVLFVRSEGASIDHDCIGVHTCCSASTEDLQTCRISCLFVCNLG